MSDSIRNIFQRRLASVSPKQRPRRISSIGAIDSVFRNTGDGRSLQEIFAPDDNVTLDGRNIFEILATRDYATCDVLEVTVGGRSLGRSKERHEFMVRALTQRNSKFVEAAAEVFGVEGILDLYAWQQHLEMRHHENPDHGFFATELQLPFEGTWAVLVDANSYADERSKTITKNLTKAVENYVSDNKAHRSTVLAGEVV